MITLTPQAFDEITEKLAEHGIEVRPGGWFRIYGLKVAEDVTPCAACGLTMRGHLEQRPRHLYEPAP